MKSTSKPDKNWTCIMIKINIDRKRYDNDILDQNDTTVASSHIINIVAIAWIK